jgi:quercetin dioxygenase-like cupin family protein
MTARASRYRWEDLPLEKITEMVARKAIAGAGESLVQAYLKKGALVALHCHEADQFIYVLQGVLRTTVDGVEFTLRDGDVLSIPAGVPHQAEAMDDTFVMTITSFG